MTTLEDMLEDITPAPDPAFVADMESRMRRGFPPKGKRRLPSFGVRPLAAIAASALLAGLVVVSLTGGDEKVSAPPQAVTQEIAPAGGDTVITDQRQGFVLQSTLTQDEQEGGSSGSFELRVPAAQLQPALNDLSRLATVRARSESGTDVTGSFESIRHRLQNARALRTSLLGRLALATTDTAENAIQRRLEIVGNRIARLRGQFRDVRQRTEFATVFVELVDENDGAVAGETDQAVDDAVGSLEDILNFLIRAVAILLPVGLVAGIGWPVVTRARRRARERALA